MNQPRPLYEEQENDKVRVALVRAPIVYAKGAFNNEATPAIGFAYLSGYLMNHGYDVEIIDAIGEGLNNTFQFDDYPGFMGHGLPLETIVERIPGDVFAVGFSGMFSGEWPVLRDLITLARKKFPEALFVAGGEHVTALPEYSLRDCPALDVIVRGEGERTFLELLEGYISSSEIPSIPGLSFIDEENQFKQIGGLPRIREIDQIPWPYWPDGYLEKFWAAGKSHGVLTERDMPMMASRGCPYQCTFCSSAQMWTTRYSLRDPDDVLDEIQHYIKKYTITSVQLQGNRIWRFDY